jgi:hypothetical protein
MWKLILKYLDVRTIFQKPAPGQEKNVNLRMMHGINRISIFMFLIALMVLFYRYFIR